ncbi:DUF4350 domain-containing protein [Caldilinea sp.]|uniref:DUF4350 domain-containing protein n=1 Tax=Caldilinea sp. TaxID=2293560 RepID=UPI002CEA9B36|nr:DUF4350 domain-containing protein [Anaerolineales bacterium]HQY90803.1 DUF4350 domain-containing protein [Caldilinea sp.]
MTGQAPIRAQHRVRLPANLRALGTPLAIAALVALLIAAALLTTPPPEPIPYDLDASHPAGLLGLRLWLEELGYTVQRTGSLRFNLPDNADLLFVYPNQLTYTAAEAASLRQWVENGGALVLIGPTDEDRHLAESFGVRLASALSHRNQQVQVQPLLPEGRRLYPREWFAPGVTLDLSEAPRAVPVLALADAEDDRAALVEHAASKVVAAVQPVGDGVVWHLAPGVDLTNGNLKGYEQGELLPALLRNAPAGGVIVFDAYHLFGFSRVGAQIATLQDWLYRTPTGWATLFVLAVADIFLLLQGRRLGPPLVNIEQTRGREAAEYVHAMANLHRRAREHTELARHHHNRLKGGLARRRAVLADLPDEQFLSALAHTSPALTDEQLGDVRAILTGLADRPSEQQIVNLAAHIDHLLHTIR